MLSMEQKARKGVPTRSRFLYWMTTFEPAFRETIEAVKYSVYSPGSVIFEAQEEVKGIYFVVRRGSI